MKNKTWVIIVLSIAAFAVGCDKQQSTTEQINKVQTETKQAAQDMKNYTYAQKAEFVKDMQAQLDALNKDLDTLSAKVDSSSDAVKAEAKPKLQTLRDQAAQLNKQLDEAKKPCWGYRFLADGHLAPIDFGYAQLRDVLTLRQMGGTDPQNQEELLMHALNFSDWVELMAKNTTSVTAKQRAAYKWVDRVDAMLNYDDMEGTVTAIKDLCTRNGGDDLKALLRQALPPGAAPETIDEAFKVLTERAKVLDKVLQTRFQKFKRAGVAFGHSEILVFAA